MVLISREAVYRLIAEGFSLDTYEDRADVMERIAQMPWVNIPDEELELKQADNMV